MSTEEARRFAVITLVSDVARAYMELRDLDLRLQISRRTLTSRSEYVQLAKLRFEGGRTSELDWRQAEAEYYVRKPSFMISSGSLRKRKTNYRC